MNHNEKKFVLFVTHYGDLYGANLSMLYMILELKKYGIEPIVLANKKGLLIDRLKETGIKFVVQNYRECVVRVDGRFSACKRLIKKLLRLITYPVVFCKLKKYDFKIVHTNSSTVDIGYYISRKKRCYHIWHVREYGVEDYGMEQIDSFSRVVKRYIESTYVIAISNSIRKQISDMSRLIRCEMIYNGVQIPKAYEKVHFDNGKVNFCIVGLISKKKCQMDAVKAAKDLMSKYGEIFCLYIIGGDINGEKEILNQYIRSENLEGCVKLTGYIDDVASYLKKMDVGLVTSNKEAFGRVTIEYMCNYMSVIGTNTGGTIELISENRTGYLYNVNCVEELICQMEKCILERDNVVAMGRAAREFASQFTIEKNARKVYELYQRIW